MPYLDKVIMKPIPEPSSKTISLQTGQIDWMDSVAYSEIIRLKQDPALVVEETLSLFIYNLLINLSHTPFQDKCIRQAMSWSLDRRAMVKGCLFGHGKIATNLNPEQSPWDIQVEKYAFQDLDRAKAFMAEAGYPNGYDKVIALMSCGIYPEMVAAGDMMTAMFKEIRINCVHTPAEIGMIIQKLIDTKDYDLYISGVTQEFDPDYKYYTYLRSELPGSLVFYNNPEADKYMDAGNQATNEKTMVSNWARALEILLDDCPFIWFFYSNHSVAYKPKLKGFNLLAGMQAYFDTVYMEE